MEIVRSPQSWVRPYLQTGERRRCLFLDRDGVLNEHIKGGYVLDWSDFVWRPGVFAALRTVTEYGWLRMVVVTNQSCIGRGLVDGAVVSTIMNRVVTTLDDAGIHLDGWYCCPHAPKDACSCRKPATGLLLAAAAELNVDLKTSYLIGDSNSDIEAARSVGCISWRVSEPEDLTRAVADVIEHEHSIALMSEVTPC